MNYLNFTTFFVILGASFTNTVAFTRCLKVNRINFSLKPGHNCREIGAKPFGRECSMSTCADLQDHSKNVYCGEGFCFFGFFCNCTQLDDWGLKQVEEREKKNMTTFLENLVYAKYKDYIHPLEHMYSSYPLRFSSEIPSGEKN